MGECMEFPQTIEEFIKNYSFKDSKEEYTNGAELIPTFRVEQALEHYGKEIGAKAIDEFANWLYERHSTDLTEYIEWYNAEIAERLKKEV